MDDGLHEAGLPRECADPLPRVTHEGEKSEGGGEQDAAEDRIIDESLTLGM